MIYRIVPTKLNITILGNGVIGTEAFLNAYWFGQMMICEKGKDCISMKECELNINIVSQDTEEVFWSKINYINPEIHKTIKVPDSRLSESTSVLVFNGKGDTNAPYCNVRYIQADVKAGNFWNNNETSVIEILCSDYFIIALGNDADNISVAEKLRISLGKKHLETSEVSKNTVIAYAVFDSELANTLNKRKRYQTYCPGKTDIYMHAFGSLEKVYCCDNIYMSRSKLVSAEVETKLFSMQMKKIILKKTERDLRMKIETIIIGLILPERCILNIRCFLSDEYLKVSFKEVNSYDFKKYDYYISETEDYLSVKELAKLLEYSIEKLIKDCIKGKIDGAICYHEKAEKKDTEKFKDWYIPFKTARRFLNEKYFELDISEESHRTLVEKGGNGVFQLFGVWFCQKKMIGMFKNEA